MDIQASRESVRSLPHGFWTGTALSRASQPKYWGTAAIWRYCSRIWQPSGPMRVCSAMWTSYSGTGPATHSPHVRRTWERVVCWSAVVGHWLLRRRLNQANEPAKMQMVKSQSGAANNFVCDSNGRMGLQDL